MSNERGLNGKTMDTQWENDGNMLVECYLHQQKQGEFTVATMMEKGLYGSFLKWGTPIAGWFMIETIH